MPLFQKIISLSLHSFLLLLSFLPVYSVYLLSCKGKLCNHILFGRIAVEGGVLCGNIEAIIGLDIAVIVLNVKAVNLKRLTLNTIIFAVVETLKDKALGCSSG